MKKEESIYQFFCELAGFIKECAAAPVKVDEPEQTGPDEYGAFLEAMKDVKEGGPG
jgi:hypothetical protein